MMLKPICVPCQRFYRMKKQGFYFIEGMPTGEGRAEPGTSEPDRWKPYKLWAGDLWKCEGCLAEIISGVAFQPVAEHYQPEFSQKVSAYQADFQVNDC